MNQGKKPETIQIICFTENGQALAERIAPFLHAGVHRSSRECPVYAWTRQHFHQAEALIYIGAAGIAVRSIAPYIKSKVQDPAVLVMDEKGVFVIPVLSGHLGGANDLARRIAAFCGATPVLTTATDVNRVFAVDEWARKNRCLVYNPQKIVCVSSKILNEETVVMQTAFPISGNVPENLKVAGISRERIPENPGMTDISGVKIPENPGVTDISGKKNSGTPEMTGISDKLVPENANAETVRAIETEKPDIVLDIHVPERKETAVSGSPEKEATQNTLYLIPGILVLGVGCRKGVSCQTIENFFRKFCEENRLWQQAFFTVASIDLKKEEPGLLRFCRNHGFSLQTFPAEELEKAPGAYTGSEFVKKVTGTDNVCERSAVCASGGKILVRKQAEDGVTLAAAQIPWNPCFSEKF